MYGLEPIVVWGLLSYGAEHTCLSLQFVIPVLDLDFFRFWKIVGFKAVMAVLL